MRTAKSCGPDAPTPASSSRRQAGPTGFDKPYSRDDGGKQARSPGRARRKPLKPLRRECRVNRCDRGDYARVLISFCMRGCGRSERPAFPAPSVIGANGFFITRAFAPRERSCHARTPVDLIGDDPGIHHLRNESFEEDGCQGKPGDDDLKTDWLFDI
jgi:hypothetical protein